MDFLHIINIKGVHMFIKKTSKINSVNNSIESFLKNFNYKKQTKIWSKGDVIPEDNVYRFIYDEHVKYSVSTFFINVGSDNERYNIKLEVTFDGDPKKQEWGISEYEITRNTNFSNNLSYFVGHEADVTSLLNDLDRAIKMKKEDWERRDE